MFSQRHPAWPESAIHSRYPRGRCMKQRHLGHRSFKMFLHLSKKVSPESGVVCRIYAKNVEIVRKLCRGERRTPQCIAGRVPVAVGACTPNDMGLQTAHLSANNQAHGPFWLGLEPPAPRRAVVSALTIAGAFIAGGCIPLGPYMLSATASAALGASVALTLMALDVFGYVKGHFTGTPPWRSASDARSSPGSCWMKAVSSSMRRLSIVPWLRGTVRSRGRSGWAKLWT
jgi:VIT family protein